MDEARQVNPGTGPPSPSASPPSASPPSASTALRRPRDYFQALRADLWTVAADPLPPLSRPRLLRWLPHLLVCAAALALAFAGTDEIRNSYHLASGLSTVLGFLQGGAVVLALRRPVPAWWLSLAVTAVSAEAARIAQDGVKYGVSVLPSPSPMSSIRPPWPWTSQGIMACALVLFLLALRVPVRASIGVLALTALVTYFLQGVQGAMSYSPTGLLAVLVLATVVLVGAALRGRREARTQLVEQASLTAEERARRTVLEERSRIARELHDVVAHHMSVISIQAQVAPHLVENPSEELRENLAGIRQNALEALTELRRVLGVLRSEDPQDPYGIGSGTGDAPDSPQPTLARLDALVENTRAAGLTVLTEISGDARPLPPGVELSAYRIIQEALSNALRHAPGSTVRVELTHFPRGVQVRVINSRPQQPVPPSPGAGHGLLGMRERAAMLGGTLVTSETSCGGYTVAAFLPRSRDQEPATGDDLPHPTGPRD
ncbi:sensor histidine kinase [Streptomyces avermitilis]|uniref:sensor histidine kinase n=1 Tax=Streptomyces avermitilis TaxID=33903 RepID=UPI0033AFFC47